MPSTNYPLPDVNEFWNTCLTSLQGTLSPQQSDAWLTSVSPLRLSKGLESGFVLLLGVQHRAKIDATRKQIGGAIIEAAKTILHNDVALKFEVVGMGAGQQNQASLDKQAELHQNITSENTPIDSNNTTVNFKKINIKPHDSQSKLDENLVFRHFVNGKANELALAAAKQIADNPGTAYSPFFLYGGVGLGKTHLIHAIGNEILRHNPSAKIRYTHAQNYVTDYVQATRRNAFDAFTKLYHNLDVLLIDDIQFFADKEGTQGAFFHAFEALNSRRSQIIMTSDTYPRELSHIEDRLVSRFSSGLTVAIEPPELEMRVAILQEKVKQSRLQITDEATFYIAKSLKSNVRELEGALRKVLAHCDFHHCNATLEVCKEALKDIIIFGRGHNTIEQIQTCTADFYKIKLADMHSKRRPASIARPRQIAMFLAKELTQKSLPEIGASFGGRDHTTVLHAVRKIGEERKTNAELNHELHVLEQIIKK